MDDTHGATRASVYDGGILRIISRVHPPGIWLEGELDRSSVLALMAALAGAAHRSAPGDGPLSVDLSGLDFIDVGGLRVLVNAGLGTGGASAGVIRMVAAPAVVRRLLRFTGWDRVPGWGEAPAVYLDEGQPDADEHSLTLVAPNNGLVLVATNTGAVDGGG
ncbi:STAS domain-containing protein [Streptosporangium sp. G11]|uniref:STAS domain-containing protein n=1 Tax=Streptosporangium sp. G11 TaxID=3436926 RepID=UPI003EB80448